MQHRTPLSIDPDVTVLLMNMFTVQHSSTRGPDREMLTFTSMFDEMQLNELRSDSPCL